MKHNNEFLTLVWGGGEQDRGGCSGIDLTSVPSPKLNSLYRFIISPSCVIEENY